jgi:hypothetical protein
MNTFAKLNLKDQAEIVIKTMTRPEAHRFSAQTKSRKGARR